MDNPAPGRLDNPAPGRRRIVVGIDGSDESRRALLWAVHLGEVEDADVEAVMVRHLPMAGGYQWVYLAAGIDPLESMRKTLGDTVIRTVGAPAASEITLRAVEGSPAAVLVSRSEHAAFLVVGSRGHGGFANLLLGSVGTKCVEHAVCPVLIVHGSVPPRSAVIAPGEARYSRVVVGVDGSSSSRRALETAGRYAQRAGAHVEVIFTWEPPEMFGMRLGYVPEGWNPQDEMDKQLTAIVDEVFGATRPADLRLIAEEGHAAQSLLRRSHDATMLVVGSRGHTGLGNLAMGSVSAKCAEHAHCAVLVVHDTQ